MLGDNFARQINARLRVIATSKIIEVVFFGQIDEGSSISATNVENFGLARDAWEGFALRKLLLVILLLAA